VVKHGETDAARTIGWMIVILKEHDGATYYSLLVAKSEHSTNNKPWQATDFN